MEEREIEVVEGAPLRYLLSVPANPAEGPRPVLFFLHGYDEAAPMDIRRALTMHGPLRPGNPPTDFIVVAPQLPRAGDLWHLYADAVRDIVAAVHARHGGDARRSYLTGFSFGGNGVFDLALARPELWAALWAVDPTRVPQRDPGRPVWLSFGEVARRQAAGFTRVLALRAEGDRVGLDEGEDHVGSATRAYRDARIYSWLLSNGDAEVRG